MIYNHVFSDITANFAGYKHNALNIPVLSGLESLTAILEKELTDSIIIDGGHYFMEQKELNILHKPDLYTAMAFETALKLYKKAVEKPYKATVSFFINDMGLCSEARNAFKKNPVLHPHYMKLLSECEFSKEVLNPVFFESTLRNRSSVKLLRRGLKNGFVKNEEGVLYIPELSEKEDSPSYANYVGHDNKRESKLIPFCRAIMAQKLMDCEQTGSKKIINILTEKEFKCLGRFTQLYHFLGGKNDVCNIILSPFEMSNSSYYYGCNYKHTAITYLINTTPPYFAQIQKYEKYEYN